MVAGLFGSVMPCFAASPDRGRTCISKPSGTSIANPVGTSAMAPGASAGGSATAARTAIPAAPGVSYAGSGSPSPCARRRMRTGSSGANVIGSRRRGEARAASSQPRQRERPHLVDARDVVREVEQIREAARETRLDPQAARPPGEVPAQARGVSGVDRLHVLLEVAIGEARNPGLQSAAERDREAGAQRRE